ncbi:hypothetical protein [Allopusillimonas ginsengisoli]|uniref:hypothetical protein n=1 Tax=Allopusillimonas ginsengisoli TaxID=453575 RepID=UPI00101F807D|nr:hypothetical protein [Allopusillimonas ginsengisoli]TEA79541.1 hypothetical protein ERE07_00860 [Allopusillimonas ginsengisoli]
MLLPFLTPRWEVAAIASKFGPHGYCRVGKTSVFRHARWLKTTKPGFQAKIIGSYPYFSVAITPHSRPAIFLSCFLSKGRSLLFLLKVYGQAQKPVNGLNFQGFTFSGSLSATRAQPGAPALSLCSAEYRRGRCGACEIMPPAAPVAIVTAFAAALITAGVL